MISLEQYIVSKKKRCIKNVSLLVGVIVVLGYFVEADIVAFFEGVPDMLALLSKMFHPKFDENLTLVNALKETIEMSILGSAIGLVLSIPFIFITSENIAPSKLLSSLLNKFFAVIRTIPSLIWAAVLVSIFSIGKFSGTISLAIISFLISQKLLRERVEEMNENELNSIRVVGATKIQVMQYAVFPSVSKHIISVFFLVLESNMRSATILGFVGAGGIGQLMWTKLNHLKYDSLSTIIFVLFFIIFVIDFISVSMRKDINTNYKIINSTRNFKIFKVLKKIFLFLVICIFIRIVNQYFSISLERFSQGIVQGRNIFIRMAHPNLLYIPKMIEGIFESLYIALFATVVSGVLSLFLTYFTAYNSSPNKMISVVFKILANVMRTFPPMIVAIIFFRGLGPGKFSGALALIVYSVGNIMKMYSEIIENVNPNIEDSIRATGASKINIYQYGLLRETFPSFIGIVLYRLESNIRNSTILGIIGAGGIGTLLNMNIIWRKWENVGMIVLVIAIMIGVVDTLSRKIRMKIK